MCFKVFLVDFLSLRKLNYLSMNSWTEKLLSLLSKFLIAIGVEKRWYHTILHPLAILCRSLSLVRLSKHHYHTSLIRFPSGEVFCIRLPLEWGLIDFWSRHCSFGCSSGKHEYENHLSFSLLSFCWNVFPDSPKFIGEVFPLFLSRKFFRVEHNWI